MYVVRIFVLYLQLLLSTINMGLLLGSGNTRPKYPYDMWYGVEGDYSSSDYKLKRVGSLDLHRSLPIQSRMKRFVENPDGSVKYYLHPNDSRKKEGGASAILDTTDGNVMLEIPEFYFRLEVSGTKWIYAISEYPLPGFVRIERKVIAPWYSTIDTVKNEAVSGCFLKWDGNEIARDSNGLVQFTENAGSCRGGAGESDVSMDGTHSSQLGMGRTTINRSIVRKYCKNGTHIGAYRAYNTIAWLQRIEYASLNCQDVLLDLTEDGFRQGGLGEGCAVNGSEWSRWGEYRPFIPGGCTAVLGNNTGKVSYTIKGWVGGDNVVQVTSYRGLEVPFQYLWMMADDVLVHFSAMTGGSKKIIAYVCSNPSKFVSPTDNSPVPDGYVPIAEIPNNDGYIMTFSISSEGYSFPESVGGNSNKGGCDVLLHEKSNYIPGWYGSLYSAAAHFGLASGFGAINAVYRASHGNNNSGFRLCRF